MLVYTYFVLKISQEPTAKIINTSTTRWVVYGGFSLALITMAVISLSIFRSNKMQSANSEAIAASIQITGEVDNLKVYVRDAETGQRGFLITGDEKYLGPYTAALSHLTPAVFSEVATHATVNKPQEAALLEDANRLTQEKLSELKLTIDLRRTLGFLAAQKVVNTNLGKDLMTSILLDTGTVSQLEEQQVARNVAANKAQTATLTATTLVGNAATLALVLTSLGFLAISLRHRQRFQQEIVASDERFTFLVRATNEAIWDRNISTNEIVWNDGVKNLFGYSKNDAVRGWKWFQEIIHPDDRARTKRGLDEALAGNAEIWNGQYRLRKQDKSYASVLDRALIIRGVNGKAIRMVGSIQDISERQVYEENLKKRTEELERFNHLMVGRESKMIELKQEIVELKNRIRSHE